LARKTLRIGLIGVGGAAQINHIPALKKIEDVELVALCDRDREKVGRVAQKFGVPKATNRFDDLLEDESIDAIDICTPNFLHAPMATAALEAGKHVLCERPLSRSADEARQMAKAARKADRVLMCAVQHRFRADAQLLRTFVDKGGPWGDLLREGRLAAAAHRVGLRRVAAARSASPVAAWCWTWASR
jgi:predicted dehydrogenase